MLVLKTIGICVLGLTLFFGTVAAPQLFKPDPREHLLNVVEFEKHWYKYLLSAARCEGEIISREMCGKPDVALDIREYELSRRAAMRLFDLEEKRARR